MTELKVLVEYIDDLLEVGRFKDYCPNGLQVNGKRQVNKLVSGVTASQALLDAAVEAGADTVLVHHGYFWKGEEPTITGLKYRRLKTLLENDISLLAYHLPLDAHLTLGNNAELGRLLGFRMTDVMPPDGVGMVGEVDRPMSLLELQERTSKVLQRDALAVSGGEFEIRKVAWCTGGAQGYIEKAFDLGADVYISGEISEPTTHFAREAGIHYLAAGHHATERYGVQALGRHLEQQFDLQHQFIDIDNPA